MNLIRSISFLVAITFVTAGATAWAAQHDPHKTHHPSAAASAVAGNALPNRPSQQIAAMDTQMKAMDAIHEKLMAAKTAEERNALMAEHTQAMQDAMTMMNGMAARGMGSKGGTSGTTGDMAAHHLMMDKRMEMMQSTMQMMMDRLPPSPAKP